MEVWILSRHVDYETSDVLDVFSTLDKAKDLNNLKEWSENLHSQEWTEFGKHGTLFINADFGHFSIMKYDVK